MAHGRSCTCNACAARRFNDNSKRGLYGQTYDEWRNQARGGGKDDDRNRRGSPPGQCEDCNGTGDCVHCNLGSYPRRDGSMASCGKCRGRLKCHACRGKGYGGRRCNTPQETVARNKQPQTWSKYGKSTVDRDTGLANQLLYGLCGRAKPKEESSCGNHQ
jgi:hypothetical protein